MKDNPQSYINLLNALTRKHPVRVAFVMFLAGFGLADFALLCKAHLTSNQIQVPLSLYIKILVGCFLSASVLYSAFGGKNGNT